MVVPPSGNPIEGVGTPVEVASQAGIFTDGPIWLKDGLYFSTYGDTSAFLKLTPPNTPTNIRNATAGTTLQGSSYDPKAAGFVSCESSLAGGGAIIRTPAAGGQGTAITLNYVDAGASAFNSPNDIVVRTDGTMFVTDPGYQDPTMLPTSNNHIWRIKPNGDVFETVTEGRPNGIGLSPDQKTLYVSFTSPVSGNPVINKYTVAMADGALGPAVKFAEVGPIDSLADGLAVDTAGNVYVGVKNGVDVFKADGSAKWGHITTTKVISNVGFGGADSKTLYMTSPGGMLQVTVKIAGLLQ